MTELPQFITRQIPSSQAMNQLVNAINALAALGPMSYQGTWDASTNTPEITSGEGVKGSYYSVSVPGSTAIDGISSWQAQDKIAFNGAAWEKIDGGYQEVLSVAGLNGAISAAALKTALTLVANDISDAGSTGKQLLQAANDAAAKAILSLSSGDISGLGSLALLNAITASQISDASANGRSLIQAANYAAMLTLLGAQSALGFTPLNRAGDTMTGPLTLSGDGTNALHAVTKQQLDAALYLMDGKQSCRFKTTGNVNLAGGGLAAGTVHDGITAVAGDRVLVGSQTTASENGIYIVPTSGAASRASDMDVWSKVPGAFVAIEAGGTVNENTTWLCTAASAGTLGSTSISWVQTSSPAAGVSSFNGRTGPVTPQAGDYTAADVGAAPTSRQVATSGLASGGGDLSANRTIDVPKSNQAEAEAGVIDNKAMTPLTTKQAIAAQVGAGNSQTFNADGTWTKPATGRFAFVQCWGGGGSGGRGGSTDGGGGGGGGGYVAAWFPLADLPSTVAIAIGAGGASVNSDDVAGNPGGTTSFGAFLSAYGGGGGGGSTVDGAGGGGGGGDAGAGSVGGGTIGGNGGGNGGGAGGAALTVGGDATSGGAGGGGGANANPASGGAGGASKFGGGGGGGGGCGNGGNGGAGGAALYGGGGGGGGKGSGTGGSPGAGGTSTLGGNGGAGSTSTTAATAGSAPGGGGGGSESGATGAGAAGRVVVTVV